MSFFDYPDGLGEPPRAPTFLSDTSESDWVIIREHAELLHVRAGETVIREGEVEQDLFIVVDGTLEATVTTGRRRRERRIATVEAGTVFGEVGFFDAGPRSAVVRAVSDAKLLRLSRDAFEFLAAKEPVLGRAILFGLGRALASGCAPSKP